MFKRFPQDFTAREISILSRHIQKANPPPLLYRYRSNSDRTLDEISNPYIFFCDPCNLNDPFEYRAPVCWDLESMRYAFVEVYAPKNGMNREHAAQVFERDYKSGIQTLKEGLDKLRNDTGVVCLSAVPISIRMWSYYASSHQGICVGYHTNTMPFSFATEVKYQNPDMPLDIVAALLDDPTKIADHLSLRKANEWSFEQEFRISTGEIGNRPRKLPIEPQTIESVRLGAAITSEFRDKVIDALKSLPHRPRLIQMHCDYDRFVLTEEPMEYPC